LSWSSSDPSCACYASPDAARRNCGRLLVEEIERIARARGLTRLEVASSLNAEPFYARLGYQARERRAVVLGNGHRLPAVMMEKTLE
jgi:GNAT superfamily N-acetyltransferase